MAINIKFDLVGNPEPPTIILANRNGNKLGQLMVNDDSIELVNKLNDASEISFTINKYINDKLTPLWDKVVDFKLVYCKEWDAWFEIKVELDEATESVKTVFCTQLGQAELSQIMLYNIEINTEKDIERDDYKISILYDGDDPEASILNRILKDKAPHYSIAYVSPTIAKIQRSFSFDGTSILDAFQEISKEISCLFQFYAAIDKNGKLQRKIAVFDLQQNCNDCGHRGEFTDKCSECGSRNITNGYGDDTLIFVTSDELASEGIQLVTDTDSVKNCFKLEAGDDLMTSTIRNCNPNGTDYIWYFSDSLKEDMSRELVEKLKSYNELYKQYYSEHVSNLDVNLLANYNSLVGKYLIYNEDLQQISTPITGYSNLMNAYYNTIDLALYLKSGLMPSVKMSETNAQEQVKLLTAPSLSPVAVTDVNTVSLATANSAVLSMSKVVVKSTFKVEIKTSELYKSGNKKFWKGKFVVTNYSDEEDVAESGEISVELNDDFETITKQKIEKVLNKENTEDLSITGLFEKEYNDFCAELKKYALNPLNSFHDACQACIDILIEQGVCNNEGWSDPENGSEANLYEKLYVPYYNKLKAIESELKIREDEISVILGVYDNDGNLIADGLQSSIEECRTKIQDALNFVNYLGEDLWLEFCAYRREDKYSNDNYISDGLNNAELFKKAQEFFEVAENEIYKSAELQHSISTTLNNLLAIEKFKSLVDSFEVGNWIRIQVDDEVFKLRLLEYGIDFGNFEIISVEFSDVIKIKNSVTDIESILSQASSMSTSYNATQNQASQGNSAKGTIDQWITNGLNSALVRIQSNNSEEITLTKNGLLCRSYDDITETYSPEQLKLTHNIMAYTDDDWKTVRQAIGKHDYVSYDKNEDKFIDKTGYGMTSDFVTAGYISGSQIIGGDIYSSNYHKGTKGSTTDLAKGTHINLITGDFELGDGRIVFDGRSVTLNGVTIKWDTTNSPEITDIGDLSDALDNVEKNSKKYTDEQDNKLSTSLTDAYQKYADSKVASLDSAVAKHLGVNGSTIVGSQYVISPYIGGGYLNITSTNNNSRVIIDPNNLTGNNYIFQVHNGKNVTLGIDKNGNASFSGTVYATDGEFTGKIIATSGEISGSLNLGGTLTNKSSDENYKVVLRGIQTDIEQPVFYIEDNTSGESEYPFFVRGNGSFKATKANITGTINATSGEIGGCEIADGKLKVNAANITGTLQANQISVSFDDLSDADDVQGNIDGIARSISSLANGGYTGGSFINGKGIISPVLYAVKNDLTTYGEFDEDSLTFYEGGTKKISLVYGTNNEYSQHYSALHLGNEKPAYIMKRFQDNHHQLWIGNNDQTIGVLFDFNDGSYKFYGTNKT